MADSPVLSAQPTMRTRVAEFFLGPPALQPPNQPEPSTRLKPPGWRYDGFSIEFQNTFYRSKFQAPLLPSLIESTYASSGLAPGVRVGPNIVNGRHRLQFTTGADVYVMQNADDRLLLTQVGIGATYYFTLFGEGRPWQTEIGFWHEVGAYWFGRQFTGPDAYAPKENILNPFFTSEVHLSTFKGCITLTGAVPLLAGQPIGGGAIPFEVGAGFDPIRCVKAGLKR